MSNIPFADRTPHGRHGLHGRPQSSGTAQTFGRVYARAERSDETKDGPAKRAAGPDGAALAKVTASKDELSLKLGSKILTLGYRTRSRRRLFLSPLADCSDQILTDHGSQRSGDQPGDHVAVLSQAQTSAGVVTTRSGRTLAESLEAFGAAESFGPFTRDSRGLTQTMPRFSVQRRLRGAPAVLLKQGGDHDYGRWLTEGLPRLALVEDHFDLQRLSFIVSTADDPMRGIFEDSLALFGVRPEQIIEAGYETLVVDALVYPAPLVRAPAQFAPRCVEVLEQIATRVRANPILFRKLYVSSGRTAETRMANEAEVIAVAKRHGFVVVEPESLSLYQQIGLFRQAKLIVGNHGPSLTNAMFSTQDLTLFALGSTLMRDQALESLMGLKGSRYLSLRGCGEAGAFVVDVERFERMLETVMDPSRA